MDFRTFSSLVLAIHWLASLTMRCAKNRVSGAILIFVFIFLFFKQEKVSGNRVNNHITIKMFP